MSEKKPVNQDSKQKDLDKNRQDAEGYLTTSEGQLVNNTDDSLKAGRRGPSLMEDFMAHEKIAHLDRERIPERLVHARGSGAHGYFQPYQSWQEITKAKFLQTPEVKTPVFVRFSNVNGSKGASDTLRDVRGFAIKFYTEEGNYDLVGNNIPVFFVQDWIKFADLVHALKPEPDREMPGNSSAHDSFWDFISLMPESMHMVMWMLSDYTLPRSYRMMKGFAVHTFRFVNEEGKARYVKLHVKPLLGVHSLDWDEAQKIAGKDPDFLRHDLWDAIGKGDYPEYELGVQIVEEGEESQFDFDILDSTKLIPEELVPITPLGKIVLDRNPDNFFAETEQVAFQPSNIVGGIDFTDDPLLQGRLFSYADTQFHRLGSANYTQLPINRPVCPVHHNLQDGFMQTEVRTTKVNYSPNSLGGGCPFMTPENLGGFVTYPSKVEGEKVRGRSPSFNEHFNQARLFWNSLTPPEKEHLVKAAQFELGKVFHDHIKVKMLELFNEVDHDLAVMIAAGLGLTAPGAKEKPKNQETSPSLSIIEFARTMPKSIKTRMIAILAADGVKGIELQGVKEALEKEGACIKIVAPHGGKIKADNGEEIVVDMTFLTSASVIFDAIYIPGGANSVKMLQANAEALHFIMEAFKHCKAIGATGEAVKLLETAGITGVDISQNGLRSQSGVISSQETGDLSSFNQNFIDAIAEHRFWGRTFKTAVPA
ncbi:MAG: Catalase HPII [Chroococcopsis gigantea SAG 12.99]|nr:catalase [Chlorogloea purpurea SAG 13.99]MDV2999656.1 Catalase HPII [Chroococcopsis gigantea SAG 12.99]